LITNIHEYDHQYFMQEALKEAEEAGKRGDRPSLISLSQIPILRSGCITI